MVRAIYAFSGDPITYGHINIVERAAKSFEELVVGIGAHPRKDYLFNLDERLYMAREALKHLSNVLVEPFSGLLVDYAYEQNIPVVVRGVRNAEDLQDEQDFHYAGATQKLGIETHLLFADPKLSHVSSSTVKAMQKEQGLIHEFVPPHVKQMLEERISGQYILGVTGEPGSGKSFVCKEFVRRGQEMGIDVYNIEMDHIGHDILSNRDEERYRAVREEIADTFGGDVMVDGVIDRRRLGTIVFNEVGKLNELNRIMETPMIVRLRREMYGRPGLHLINAALLAEADMSYLSNNNTLVVWTDKNSQWERLSRRGWDSSQISRRIDSQYNTSEKVRRLKERVERDRYGTVYSYDNRSSMRSDDNLSGVFERMLLDLRVAHE